MCVLEHIFRGTVERSKNSFLKLVFIFHINMDSGIRPSSSRVFSNTLYLMYWLVLYKLDAS